MKIGINIQSVLKTGKSGVGFYQHELMRALLRSDSENEYFLNYFDLGNKFQKLASSYLTPNSKLDVCTWFGARAYQALWSIVPVPYKIFFKTKPDVSVFFNYYLPSFPCGKKVLVVYDTVIKDYPETVRFRTKMMLSMNLGRSIRNADRIITISQFSKNQIIKHFGIDSQKITVIPCAADIHKFHPISLEDEEKQSVRSKYGIQKDFYLYLGNLEPRKNIPRLIDAYAKAKKQQADIPLMVISGGKGWLYKEIFKKVEELSLQNDVIFTGYVDDGDVPLLMNIAKAFCFPSLYEGFGMPPLEAMASGTPVIVSNVSSLPEVVGDCGISVNPYNVDEIASALIHALDETVQAEQRKLGIERAKFFSWDRSAAVLKKTLEDLYDE